MGNNCRNNESEPETATIIPKVNESSLDLGFKKLKSTFKSLKISKDAPLEQIIIEIDRPRNATLFPNFKDRLPDTLKTFFHKAVMKFRYFPAYVLEDGEMYEGCWLQGKKHGLGISISVDDIIKYGIWEHNQLIDGVTLFPNGDKKLKDKYIYADGTTFVGDEHHGKETFQDGTIYDGDFKNGQRHGKGAIYFRDGSSFIGDFYEGKFHGYGIFYFANQDKYEGQWLLDQMHGQGELICKDGRIYRGGFRYGYKHGEGVMKYKDGSEFQGNFNMGYKDGKGKWIQKNQISEEEWQNGFIILK